MSAKSTAHTVRFGQVSIKIRPWKHSSGRDYYRGDYTCPATGARKRITAPDLPTVKERCLTVAKAIARGNIDLDDLSPHVARSIRRLLDRDPEMTMVDEFLAWHARRAPVKLLGEALDEFFVAKEAARGRSVQNLKTLRTRLKILDPLRGKNLCDVTLSDLAIRPDLQPKTILNIRGSVVTFFAWCREREYLPHAEKTVAERIEKPLNRRKVPDTYTPAQLRILLDNVRERHLSWLAAVAFGGFRADELHPLRGGEKSPLDWSDFRWASNSIIVRPETDKNGQGRVVPILPALRAWLWPLRAERGPVVATSPFSGKYSETTRLGKLIGGWSANALRHSWISYRAATEGLAKTAMEAGNSESEARRSYNDAKSPDEALEWFGVFPFCHSISSIERIPLDTDCAVSH